MRVWLGIITALVLATAGGTDGAGAAVKRERYAPPAGTCDGYPRLAIGMVGGMCAGLVAGPPPGDFAHRQLRLPRSLVTPDGGQTWLITDLGRWDAATGAVWRLKAAPGQPPQLTRLLTGLTLPHTILIGPDGKAYVGEMQRVIRFEPGAVDPAASVETVISGLPANRLHDNRHPLSAFVFAADGALIVNVGAPSDQCLDEAGKPVGDRACAESEGDEPTAVLRRYAYLGHGRWSGTYTVLARGLRNSVALGVHASGTLLQGENSYDTGDRWSPFDEINVIQAGRHYGWPYCADMDVAMPGWAGTGAMDCRSGAHAKPALLIAPHAAPLALTWYDGPMFPQLRGRLLMTWHGYRSTGGRIVAYDLGADGVPIPGRRARYETYAGPSRAYGRGPSATPLDLTPGWGKLAGVRPQGTPVGLAVAGDGAIWVADDKNAVIIRIAADRP
jgi:glucose/arabinose dehydrogenase